MTQKTTIYAVPGRMVGRVGLFRGFYGYDEVPADGADHVVPGGRSFSIKPDGERVDSLTDGVTPRSELIRLAIRHGDLSITRKSQAVDEDTQAGGSSADGEG